MSQFSINILENKILGIAGKPIFPWLLALILVVASMLLSWPCINCFDAQSNAWEVVQRKAADLLDPLHDVPEYLWLSKKVFRLTVPLIISITGLGPAGTIVLQYVVNFLLFVFAFKLALRAFKDPIAATWLTAGLAFLYFGRAGLHDLEHLWFDGFAFFFLIMAMHAQRPITIFLWSTAAAWTDERAFMALGIVCFFQLIERSSGRVVKSMVPKANSVAVLIGIGLYLAIRAFLAHQYGMQLSNHGAGLASLSFTMLYLPLGIWTFLEGYWIILIATIILTFRSTWHFSAFFISAATLSAIVISGCVTDITRSGSYLVPIVFVCLLLLRDLMNGALIRRMLFVTAAITLLFPAVFVCPGWEIARWLRPPLPVQILRVLLEGGMHRSGSENAGILNDRGSTSFLYCFEDSPIKDSIISKV